MERADSTGDVDTAEHVHHRGEILVGDFRLLRDPPHGSK